MSRVFITGGTGSLGRFFVNQIYNGPQEIVVYSRNEYQQYRMKRKFPKCKYILGDVRDFDRLKRSINDDDVIIHMAAIKHVSSSFDNPEETIDINVNGTLNVIKASKDENCYRCVFISTDKAVDPINIYGSTKLIGEDLFLKEDERFKIIRGGNLMGSSGSVLPLYLDLVKKGKKKLSVSSFDVSRYWTEFEDIGHAITRNIRDSSNKIYTCVGEEFFIKDLVIALGCTPVESGMHPGEKRKENINRFDTEFDFIREHKVLSVKEIKERIKRVKGLYEDSIL